MWLLRITQPLRSFSHATTRAPRLLSLLGRVSAIVLTCAMLLSAGFAAAQPASAHGAHDAGRDKDYLALGDSIAFGYSPLLNRNQASNFIGYPTPVAHALDLKLTNAACPGVATGYFISLSGVDWDCIPYRSQFPLHVSYTTSQLDYAVSFLRSHPRTRLVTIDIGVNNLFRLQSLCGGAPSCILSGLPGTLATISTDLDTIYGAIRHRAHYHGQLVALTYYSTNYQDAFTTGAVEELDKVITARTLAWGGAVADGFGAFKAASSAFNGNPCTAGLLIRVSATACDVHPSVTGRNLLAVAILAVLRRQWHAAAA
ncbi:MAG TPA: SGNH/GDSL hydrolase family protein [Ktedonobacterales bacterium]